MALSETKKEEILALFKQGNMSNVQIGKIVGCGESAVRTTVKKAGAIKNEITDLVHEEIVNTIKGNEIKTRKSELTRKEREVYDDTFISLSSHLNLFNSAAIAQLLVNQAHEDIIKDIKDKKNTITALDHLPNIMATSKITETNRKQLYGVTETFKHKEEEDGTPQTTTIQYIEDIVTRD